MIGSITYLLKKTPKCLSIFLLLVFMLHDQPIRADSKFVDLDVIVEEAKIITGRVFDANNEPLIGATILEKGTSNGVVTDIDGKFSISVDNNSTALMISYVGYVSQEVDISSSNTVEVVMLSDATTLNEVTVIGYGSVRKSDLSGSVSSVKGTDLKELPTQRVDQALQGRAAGVSVQNTDGSPGGSTIIRIRGGNSVNGGNNALVVVDGLQGVDISTINPNDIETVEVLKDASATAVYGARGANGVIIVTTKRGSSAKPVISYNFSGGSQSLAKKLDLLSPADFARKANVYAATQNGTPAAPIVPVIPFTESQISALANGGGTDWQDELYRAGSLYNHQLSITGGNNQARYYVSGGMVDQQGIVINSQYKRYNLRSNLDLKVNDWLSGGFNLNVIKAKGNVPPVGEGTRFGDILGQVINTVARFDPATPVYDESGSYNFRALRGGPDGSKIYADPDVWNPVATALETKSERNSIINEVSTFLDFKILEGLTFRVTGSAAVNNSDNLNYYSSKTQPGRGAPGTGNLSEDKYQFYQNSNILTYNTTIRSNHKLSLTGVAEQQLNLGKGSFISANGFFNDLTGINDFGGASNIGEKSNYDTKTVLNSFLGRVNYAYADKYLLTVSARADGSSVFGANNKWGYFPSAAVAWRITEEGFLKDSKTISNLKLRASWGKTGNQAIQPYQTLGTVGSGFNYAYYGDGSYNIGYALARPGNPDLKWETTAQSNLGMDLGLFNERLTATVDFYRKVTSDLLLNATVEAYTGFTSKLANVGSIQNEGMELSIGATPIAGGSFTWNTNVVTSFNRSKVLELSDGASFIDIRTNTGGGYNIWRGGNNSLKQLRVGEPVNQMIGYTVLGTWGTDEAEEARKYGQAPGSLKFKDVDGDGRITRAADGQEVIGNSDPNVIFGWNNSLTYKGFGLNFLLQGSYGNEIFNAVRIKLESPANGTGANLNNAWTPDNQNTNVPGFYYTSQELNLMQLGASRTADATGGADNRWSNYVEDGSYVRLKNITLSYNLPSSLLSKIKVPKLAVSVSGANLLTLTNYTGYDPEVSSFNLRSAGGDGIDLSNYPSSKTIMFGLNVSF